MMGHVSGRQKLREWLGTSLDEIVSDIEVKACLVILLPRSCSPSSRQFGAHGRMKPLKQLDGLLECILHVV